MVDTVLAQMQLDFQEKTPLAEQIRLEIAQLIDNRELLPGDQLPTVRQMALQLNVNFNTVARAYRWLDEAGQIITRQGRGTFVTEKPARVIEGEEKTQAAEILLSALVDRLIADAMRMGLSWDEIIATILDKSPQEPEIWIAPSIERTAPRKRFHPRGRHAAQTAARKRRRLSHAR